MSPQDGHYGGGSARTEPFGRAIVVACGEDRNVKSVVAVADATATTPLTRCGWRRRVAEPHPPSCVRRAGGQLHTLVGRCGEPLTTAATRCSQLPRRPTGVPVRVTVDHGPSAAHQLHRHPRHARRPQQRRADVDDGDVAARRRTARAGCRRARGRCRRRRCPWSPNSARRYAASIVTPAAPADHVARRRCARSARRGRCGRRARWPSPGTPMPRATRQVLTALVGEAGLPGEAVAQAGQDRP